MAFRVHHLALVDVDETVAWYNSKVAGLGDEFRAAFLQSLDQIRRSPESASFLETVTMKADLRRRTLKRFPYLLIYQLYDQDVEVLAVVHESRHPNAWVDRVHE